MKASAALAEGNAGFAARFGGPPDAVYVAPGRVNLIGEHTDYQQGLCLPMAIDLHVAVAARRRTDRQVEAYSHSLESAATANLDTLRPGPRGHWFNYVAGVIAGLQAPYGVDLYFFGDLPRGAGLSSSAALEIVTATAINDLFALGRTPEEVALIGQAAEHDFAGVSCGIMDQFASVFGRQGNALLLDTRLRSITPVPFLPEEVGLTLGVVDTRAEHHVTGGGYQERFEQARAAAGVLGVEYLRDASPGHLGQIHDPLLQRRARHIVTENRRVMQVVEAAGRGEWAAVGSAFYASHRSLAEDYEVSHPALDAVVQAALGTEGVFGARLTGAGFGGSAIVLMEALAEDDFLSTLRRAYARHDWPPFSYMAVRAGAGASRCAE